MSAGRTSNASGARQLPQTPVGQTERAKTMPLSGSEGGDQTPTVRYQEQCVQHLADRLTALEDRMSESEFRAKHTENVQAQSAAAIAEMQEGLEAQQCALEGMRRSLAPLEYEDGNDGGYEPDVY